MSLFEDLRAVRNIDLAFKDGLCGQSLSGTINHADLFRTRGDQLSVKAEFINNMDLAEAEFDEITLTGDFNYVDFTNAVVEKLTLKGRFILVDLSNAKIGTLIMNEAEVITLDRHQAKVNVIA